jgi:hypothetical protein
MLRFTSIDKISNNYFVIELYKETYHFDHLRNHKVIIDNEIYTILNIGYYAHVAPWKKGEGIIVQVKIGEKNEKINSDKTS